MDRQGNLHQFSIDHPGRVREENFAVDECNAEMRNVRLSRGTTNNKHDNRYFTRDELQVLEFSNLLTGKLMMGKRIQSLFTDSETSCGSQWDFEATPKQPHNHLPWHETCQMCNRPKMKNRNILPCNYKGKYSVAIELPQGKKTVKIIHRRWRDFSLCLAHVGSKFHNSNERHPDLPNNTKLLKWSASHWVGNELPKKESF